MARRKQAKPQRHPNYVKHISKPHYVRLLVEPVYAQSRHVRRPGIGYVGILTPTVSRTVRRVVESDSE